MPNRRSGKAGGRPARRADHSTAESLPGLPLFALRVGLGPVPASANEVRCEIGERLDAYEPRLMQKDADLELSLTIAAADLWVAMLLAMAAVTGTGYPVEWLHARPGSQATP